MPYSHPRTLPWRGVRFSLATAGVALATVFAVSGCAKPTPPDSLAVQEFEAVEATPPPQPRAPLAWFEGPQLGGGSTGADLLRGRRGLVYVFASTDHEADLVARIVTRIQPSARSSNIAILGLSRDADPERGERFVRRHGFEFPVVLDAQGSISREIGVPEGKPSLVAVDAEGYLLGGFAGIDGDFPDQDVVYEREVRRLLHLETADGLDARLGVLPEAPEFRLVSLDGKRVTRSGLLGKVVVFVFFSPSCPHCRQALQFLQRLTDEFSQADLEIVSVSILNRRYLVEDMLQKLEVRFAGYLDPDYAVQKAYAHRYAVPEIIVITREGRVYARHQGISTRIEALLTMEVRQALGVENVILLEKTGYSGGDNCQICHRQQHETWALTKHAYAFESLVEHGAGRDPECLPCHTVGWNVTGGYNLETPLDYLEGVQCESCHGRGGSHQSLKIPPDGYEPVCMPCHTPKHSLNFVFAERLPFVSHAANLQVTTLSIEERHALRSKHEQRERSLFHSDRFVGSEACRSCHFLQYELWAQSRHASALESLRQRSEEWNPECQRCHTTGFGQGGGFPEGGEALASVGCESCHGPGASHVRETAPGGPGPSGGMILALGDKCDSCVLLRICGSCHDPENDPGFEFEMTGKVERLRHGYTVVGSITP